MGIIGNEIDGKFLSSEALPIKRSVTHQAPAPPSTLSSEALPIKRQRPHLSQPCPHKSVQWAWGEDCAPLSRQTICCQKGCRCALIPVNNLLLEGVRLGLSQKKTLWDSTNSTARRVLLLVMGREWPLITRNKFVVRSCEMWYIEKGTTPGSYK